MPGTAVELDRCGNHWRCVHRQFQIPIFSIFFSIFFFFITITGFGIFCFVVFILTLVACIGGCVFKYVKLHARGVEVLPFIDQYRSWYGRFCNKSGDASSVPYKGVVFQSGVGPQAQFDAPLPESAGLTSGSAGSAANPFGGGYQASSV